MDYNFRIRIRNGAAENFPSMLKRKLWNDNIRVWYANFKLTIELDVMSAATGWIFNYHFDANIQLKWILARFQSIN